MNSRIESLGVFENQDASINCSIELIKRAATECLAKSRHLKSEIGVLVNVSIYRDHYFAEPAFATFLQNELGINHDLTTYAGPRTLAFDLYNGSLGFLSACQAVGAMISQGTVKAGLVVSGDALDYPISEKGDSPGFRPVGAAMLLDRSPEPDQGFYSFLFQHSVDHLEAYQSSAVHENKQYYLVVKKDPDLENLFLQAIAQAVSRFLARRRLEMECFDLIIPPQISRNFINRMSTTLSVSREKLVDVTCEDGDLFTSSLPFAMEHVLRNGLARPGQKALIVNVGSGLQVGCATYTF